MRGGLVIKIKENIILHIYIIKMTPCINAIIKGGFIGLIITTAYLPIREINILKEKIRNEDLKYEERQKKIKGKF